MFKVKGENSQPSLLKSTFLKKLHIKNNLNNNGVVSPETFICRNVYLMEITSKVLVLTTGEKYFCFFVSKSTKKTRA